MKNLIINLKIFLFFIILTGMVCCDKEELSNSQESNLEVRSAEIDRDSFDFISPTCFEDIHFTGTVKFVYISQFTNPAGNNTFSFAVNAKGTGVGLTSGNTYNWNDNITFRTKLIDPNASTQHKVITRIIGKAGAPSFKIVFVFKEIYNARGELTAVKMIDIQPECE